MNRRTLIKTMSYGTLSAIGGSLGWRLADSWRSDRAEPGPSLIVEPVEPFADEGGVAPAPSASGEGSDHPSYLEKIRDFDRTYAGDVILEGDRWALLETVAAKLSRARRTIGHGHFNLLSFDTLLKYARRYRRIGAFQPQELDFFEELFFADAEDYGFFGDKVLPEMTAEIPERDAVKIAGTGHYLFRGEPQNQYERMRQDLDGGIFLTSGIRNVVKQMQLFLDKAVTTGGNLSQASRSLAPPGYSYHAVGDFDIGKVGAGLDNFNEVFAETDEYKKLVDLGYVELRYTPANPFGVRHEPWHIKMKT